MQLILASNSPRRKDILQSGGYEFLITSSDFDENTNEKDPKKLAMCLAKGKARTVFDGLKEKDNFVVLGADTVVYIDDKILGKPKDEKEARSMLNTLSGREHNVVTGFCVVTSCEEICSYSITKVLFNQLTNKLIDYYIKSGLYKGKAGSYGIQDGFELVKEFNGSYSNVVGLPQESVFPILDKFLTKK